MPSWVVETPHPWVIKSVGMTAASVFPNEPLFKIMLHHKNKFDVFWALNVACYQQIDHTSIFTWFTVCLSFNSYYKGNPASKMETGCIRWLQYLLPDTLTWLTFLTVENKPGIQDSPQHLLNGSYIWPQTVEVWSCLVIRLQMSHCTHHCQMCLNLTPSVSAWKTNITDFTRSYLWLEYMQVEHWVIHLSFIRFDGMRNLLNSSRIQDEESKP